MGHSLTLLWPKQRERHVKKTMREMSAQPSVGVVWCFCCYCCCCHRDFCEYSITEPHSMREPHRFDSFFGTLEQAFWPGSDCPNGNWDKVNIYCWRQKRCSVAIGGRQTTWLTSWPAIAWAFRWKHTVLYDILWSFYYRVKRSTSP